MGTLVLIHPWDSVLDADEWRGFAEQNGFGELVAAGRGRDVAVIVPTQFVLAGDELLVHLARPNPIWGAIEENDRVILAVSGDWAYIPTAWKAIGKEDPALGVPTTYYASVQFVGTARIVDDAEGKLDLLRRQLAALESTGGYADPAVHRRLLSGLRGLRIRVDEVRAKFKYGGNVDERHRLAVAERLAGRGRPGDTAARSHLLRRLEATR